jgi:hypothetical protein
VTRTLYDQVKPVLLRLAERGLVPHGTYPIGRGSYEDRQDRYPYQWRYHGVNMPEDQARLVAMIILMDPVALDLDELVRRHAPGGPSPLPERK